MIEPRLTSDFQIFALKRLAEADGSSLTVIRKGDRISGGILTIGQVRGENPVVFQKFPSLDGKPVWQPIAMFDAHMIEDTEAKLSEYWRKAVSRDPDLWVIELDVASMQRLNDLMGTLC